MRTAEPTPTQKSQPRHLKTYFSLPLVLLYLTNMFQGFSFSGSLIFLPAYMAKRTSFHIFSLDSVALGGCFQPSCLGWEYWASMAEVSCPAVPVGKKALVDAHPFLSIYLAMSFTTDLLLLIFALLFFFFNFFLQPMNNTLLAQYTTVEMRGQPSASTFSYPLFSAHWLQVFAVSSPRVSG